MKTKMKIKYAEFNGDVHFFLFRSEIPFLGKFGPKKSKLSVLKLDTMPNSSMQNSVMLFTSFALDRKYPFGANLVEKKIKLSV